MSVKQILSSKGTMFFVSVYLCMAVLGVPTLHAQIITTVAGDGTSGFGGDDGPATSASLDLPAGVAVDGFGNLFIADELNERIRRVDGVTGIITTVAGNGVKGFGGDDGPATSANFDSPVEVAVDGFGNLFIVDFFNHRIRRVDGVTGIITTVAGNGVLGFSGDGGPATSANLRFPAGVAMDGFGNLFIADTANHRIRFVDGVTGFIYTLVGNGVAGYCGDWDGSPFPLPTLPPNACLRDPTRVAMDAWGNLFIADTANQRIRLVPFHRLFIVTMAGNGVRGFGGDGGPATSANLAGAVGVAVDASGNLFIADSANQRIRRVDGVTGIITTVAGNGVKGFGGDDGPATSASLGDPEDVAVDASGNLFIADSDNDRIRKVALAP